MYLPIAPRGVPLDSWLRGRTLPRLTTRVHPLDLVLMEQAPKFGNPPVLLADMRPKEPPLLFIFNNAVAEQLTKPTKQFPTSIPKTPGMKNLSPLVGERSLVNLEVSQEALVVPLTCTILHK